MLHEHIFAFLRVTSIDFMSTANYWPKRPDPKGFSIQQLAKNYREKIAKISFEGSKTDVPIPNCKNTEISKITLTLDSHFGHWANRDFKEYY